MSRRLGESDIPGQLGLVQHLSALRWTGIALLGLTAGKVFLLDLAQVEVLYRILSLLVLGVLLVAASFVYARYRSRLTPPPLVKPSATATAHRW